MANVPQPPPNPYKMLSKTFQSSVRYTPGYLDRITLDEVRYQQYQDQVRAATIQPQTQPREVKRMGDKYFYVHRNIPIKQQYDRTSLKRSEVRPWDELVDRPLMTPRVRDKEVQLPYPQEHPHNSHIPHYLAFPDPYPHPPNPLTNPPLTPKTPRRPLSAGIAHRVTPPPLVKAASPDIDGGKFEGEGAEGNKEEEKDDKEAGQLEGMRSTNRLVVDHRHPCNPPRKNYIARKAYDSGTRVEVVDLREPGRTPEMEHLLWQMPKFSRKRCITYPTPSHQFSRQTTTPNYLQLCSPSSSSSSYLHSATPTTPAHLQQHVHDTVSDFHRAMCRTTSYRDHFPAHPVTPSSRGGIDRSLRSVSSFRPFTSEQRGKYHFNTGGGASGLATPTPRPGTTAQTGFPPPPPPELKKIDSIQLKERTSDVDNDHYRGRSEDATITIDDNEEMTAMETSDKAATCGGGSVDSIKEAKNKDRDGDGQSLPAHLSGTILRKPRPKSCSGRVSSASRVMTQQHKFPLLQERNYRFPPIQNDNNNSSLVFPPDSARKMAFATLGTAPPSNRSVGGMVTPPSLRMKRAHAHHNSLPSPRRLVSQSYGSDMQQVSQGVPPKQPSNAQIVKQFTRNLQRELYTSPDMRGVTMKEGKKHGFFGHHGYDFH